jgi:hypothetical protein
LAIIREFYNEFCRGITQGKPVSNKQINKTNENIVINFVNGGFILFTVKLLYIVNHKLFYCYVLGGLEGSDGNKLGRKCLEL